MSSESTWTRRSARSLVLGIAVLMSLFTWISLDTFSTASENDIRPSVEPAAFPWSRQGSSENSAPTANAGASTMQTSISPLSSLLTMRRPLVSEEHRVSMRAAADLQIPTAQELELLAKSAISGNAKAMAKIGYASLNSPDIHDQVKKTLLSVGLSSDADAAWAADRYYWLRRASDLGDPGASWVLAASVLASEPNASVENAAVRDARRRLEALAHLGLTEATDELSQMHFLGRFGVNSEVIGTSYALVSAALKGESAETVQTQLLQKLRSGDQMAAIERAQRILQPR